MARLADEGVLEARPGHGTFLAPRPANPPEAADFAWQGIALGAGRITADDVAALLAGAPAGAINLAGGYPPEDLQAVDLVSRALARAARRPGVWGRMPLEGIDGLRTWFARQLGSAVTAREVIVCPGSQAAIATAFHALTEPGAAVLVESPSYVGALVAARAAGLRLVPVPTDADGVVPELLARAFEASGARVFYTQPLHANPSGATLAAARRRQVLDIVARHRALVIEDDFCRDLSFEKAPSRPLICDDRHGHCVYLRSLTKSVAPGLESAPSPPGARLWRGSPPAGPAPSSSSRGRCRRRRSRSCTPRRGSGTCGGSARRSSSGATCWRPRCAATSATPAWRSCRRAGCTCGCGSPTTSTARSSPGAPPMRRSSSAPAGGGSPAEPTGSYLRVSYAGAAEADLRAP